jgi:hypothetical protein
MNLRICITTIVLGLTAAPAIAHAENADWAYVTAAWGGLVVASPSISAESVHVPLKFWVAKPTRMDSAICITGISGKLRDKTIVVSVSKGLCGLGRDVTDWSFDIPRPPAGSYSVVYNDKTAGYPAIGTVDVP